MHKAAIGLVAKTGRAIAVVLVDPADSPAFLWRGELSLVDPEIPATAEPYHTVMDLPRDEAAIAVRGLVAAIERRATVALRELIAEMRLRDVEVRVVGVVGAPQRSLDRIGNHHIRAHAAEGVLFRQVLELASRTIGLPCHALTERESQERGSTLGDGEYVATTLQRMGCAAGAPWRVAERLAATAAWLALTSQKERDPLNDPE
jgi:hypothetical protein